MKKYLLLILLLVFILLLSACGSPKPAATSIPPVPADYAGLTNPLGAEGAAAGAKTFETNCMACHGVSGLGDGPAGESLNPRPASLPALAAQVGDDYLFWRISTGKPGTSMVGWEGVLTGEQIWELVSFIRMLK